VLVRSEAGEQTPTTAPLLGGFAFACGAGATARPRQREPRAGFARRGRWSSSVGCAWACLYSRINL